MNEDAVLTAIGNLQGRMDGIDRRIEDMTAGLGRELRDLRDAMKEEGRSCKDCRKEIDKDLQAQADIINARIDKQNEKIAPIQDQHRGEAAVTSWIDQGLGRVGNILGILSIGIVVLSAALQFAAWLLPVLGRMV